MTKEEIIEMAREAGIKHRTDEFYSEFCDGVYFDDLVTFAELIVKECIEIVKPTSHHEVWAQGYLGGVDGLELLGGKIKQIKQHFGVE